MDRRTILPVGLAFVGLVTVLVGLHQDLLTVRAAYDGTVTTGWGRDLNHTERKLGLLATVALPVAAAAARYRYAGYLVQAAGAAVTWAALSASVHWLLDPVVYSGLPVAGGTSGAFVLGAEPYLLLVGGLLLVAAGVAGAHPSPYGVSDSDAPRSASATR